MVNKRVMSQLESAFDMKELDSLASKLESSKQIVQSKLGEKVDEQIEQSVETQPEDAIMAADDWSSFDEVYAPEAPSSEIEVPEVDFRDELTASEALSTILIDELGTLIPSVHEWYKGADQLRFVSNLTSAPINGMLSYKIYNSPSRSCIKGIQLFAYVPVYKLRISKMRVLGGLHQFLLRQLSTPHVFEREGQKYFAVYKRLAGYDDSNGAIIAFIKEIPQTNAHYYMLTEDEVNSLCIGEVPETLKRKLRKIVSR